jgi:hypothetical protein
MGMPPGPLSPYDRERLSEKTGNPQDSASGHLLSHVKQESPVAVINATHEPAKLVQKTSLFPSGSPNDFVGASALRKVGKLGGLFSIVEELIERDFEGAGHFLECFDGRNGMAILHAGNIAAKQSCPLFDVPLGKLLFFAQNAKPIADNHVGIVTWGYTACKGKK